MTDPAIPPRHPRGEERTITLVRGDVQSFARIVWGTTGDRRYFVALDGPTGHLEATDRDYFEALARIREQLEPAGWLVALQGARRQTFPSGMLRDTAGARRVYVLEPGRPVRRDGAVRTFDPADPQDLATVD